MRLYAGTSGFGFREWVGAFYPEGTKPAGFLRHYASVFASVEINHTFRRFPKPELVASWAESVPSGFRFSVKAHQSITHKSRLRDAGEATRSFLDALKPLGDRLGPVLFQCPPWLRRDDDRLETFLDELPPGGEYAFEFRHESWSGEEVEETCRRRGAALVAAVSELAEEPVVPVTSSLAYVRLRRDPPYSEAEWESIAGMVDGLSDRVETLYLYVKHDGPGLAPDAVARIRSLAPA